jgi:hypothetical protein
MLPVANASCSRADGRSAGSACEVGPSYCTGYQRVVFAAWSGLQPGLPAHAFVSHSGSFARVVRNTDDCFSRLDGGFHDRAMLGHFQGDREG